MRRPAALSPIALALGAIILAPGAGAREEGPTEIEKCQTISNPGSYKLVNNLVAPTTTDPFVPCLFITANFVTIDLAGFSIDAGGGTGILSTGAQVLHGLAVRNGSISKLVHRAVENSHRRTLGA